MLVVLMVISFFAFLFAAYEIYHLFNIYEFSYEITYDKLSRVLINHYPINAFGFKVPLRKIETKFKIIEGIGTAKCNSTGKSEFIIESSAQHGKFKILAKPKGFSVSSLIEIDLK